MPIRLANENDAEQILAIYAPFCLPQSHVSFEIEPPSLAEMKERIKTIGAIYPWLVWEELGKVIGYVYASKYQERAAYQWSTSLAVYLAPEAKGKGISQILCQTLFSILRQLGYFNIYGGTTLPNPASEGLMRSLGFNLVGVLSKVGFKAEKWLDVAIYGLALQPHEGVPEPPKSITQIDVNATIEEATRALIGI